MPSQSKPVTSPSRGRRASHEIAFAHPAGSIHFFAVVGSAMIALAIYCWTRWILSSDFAAVPTGPDPLDSWKLLALRGFEFVSLAVAVWLYWFAVFRPLRTGRPLGFDGKLVIGSSFCYVLDPTASLMNAPYAFNAYTLNMGSWAEFLPFMKSPGQALQADGPLWAGAYYVYLGLGIAICGRRLLRALDQWRSGMSNFSRYAVIFIAVMVFDFVLENAMVRAEMYSFCGVAASFSLWVGSIYQFPLYECVFVAFICTPLVYLRESRDDRGRSLAERGVDQLNVSPRAREAISFLAITGFASLCFLAYWLPIAWMSNYADSYPPLPSYMRAAAYCGTPGSGRYCSGQLINMREPTTVVPYDRQQILDFVEGKRFAPIPPMP